jgi:hypothetical protein
MLFTKVITWSRAMTKQKIFDYLLVRLVDWYIEQNALNNYSHFNQENDFSRSKLSLLPFIICTANGKRKDLFGKFDNFVAKKEGNIENSLEYEDTFFQCGVFSTVFKIDAFINHANPISDNDLMPLINIPQIDEIDTEVIVGINNSISHIRNELQLSELINYSAEELSSIHKRQSSWRAFYSLPPEILNAFNGAIPTDFLVSEKSPLAFNVEKRIFA